MPTQSNSSGTVHFDFYKDRNKLKVRIDIKGICFHYLIRDKWSYPLNSDKIPVMPHSRQSDYDILIDLVHIWGVKNLKFRDKSFTIEKEENIPWAPILKEIYKYLNRYLELRIGNR